jgi:hypothetical protein
VFLDSELAPLYGVETRVLNQAAKLNTEHFPEDFRFQLTPAEAAASRSQCSCSNKELAKRLDQLEARIEKKLATHDETIAAMLSAIRELKNPPVPNRRGMGFTAMDAWARRLCSPSLHHGRPNPPSASTMMRLMSY